MLIHCPAAYQKIRSRLDTVNPTNKGEIKQQNVLMRERCEHIVLQLDGCWGSWLVCGWGVSYCLTNWRVHLVDLQLTLRNVSLCDSFYLPTTQAAIPIFHCILPFNLIKPLKHPVSFHFIETMSHKINRAPLSIFKTQTVVHI